jgi:hypothetical protein
MLIPVCVRVPVLSKQTVSILPLIMIFGGEIQKMPVLRSLSKAKLTPKLMAAGSVGGIVIVKLSENVMINPFKSS